MHHTTTLDNRIQGVFLILALLAAKLDVAQVIFTLHMNIYFSAVISSPNLLNKKLEFFKP